MRQGGMRAGSKGGKEVGRGAGGMREEKRGRAV